jgi:hypothetical protein
MARFILVLAVCVISLLGVAVGEAMPPSPPTGTRQARSAPVLLAQYPAPANACCTPHAPCPLTQPQPIGSGCFCYSPYGPIRGYACRL